MKTVVLVPPSGEKSGEKTGWVEGISGEAVVVHTITEAREHFNGAAPRVFAVSATVPGVADFVQELRRGGYNDTRIIAVADGAGERDAVMDRGFSCVVSRAIASLSVAAFLS
ncbi:hypothetical protein KGQ31_01330 [Patescibacteria group bacterium]|nr:hypothetical protein [Patescibacteria group bacterium]